MSKQLHRGDCTSAMEAGDTFVFCKSEHVCNYLTSFQSMKEKGELCDVVFKAGNATISAHRVILAAGIPYFKDMFIAPDVSNKLESEIGQIDSEALVSLLNFLYTGKIEISTENMLSLFSTSAFLRVSEIQEACCQFISKRITVENVMKVRKIAADLSCGILVERSDTYILEQFGKFSQTDEFLTMPFSSVKKLIYDDYLRVESEEEVFEAVMKWVECSNSERQPVLPELLKGVRMTLLSPTYLFERVSCNEKIRESAACRDLLDEVMFHMLFPEKRHLFRSFSTSPRQNWKKIYAICTSKSACSVKFYNTESNTWSLLSTNNTCYHFVDAFVYSDTMYLFDGKTFGSVNLKNHEWGNLEPIRENTCGAGVVFHGNSIYVFGSSLFHLSHQVRCYDIFRNIRLKKGYMIKRRSEPRVVSMNGSMYVAGGCWNSEVLNSIERYDPGENKSYLLTSMLVSRYWFGICALKGRIYICGGCDKNKHPYNSAEVFDPGSNQWSLICPLNVARYSFSLVSLNRKLYAVGGKMCDGKVSNGVEIYDPESNAWTFGVPLDVEDDSIISLRACTG